MRIGVIGAGNMGRALGLALGRAGHGALRLANSVQSHAADPRFAGATSHLSLRVCSDDSEAKLVVKRLCEELGFVGVDSGDLERAQLVEAVADFIRFQIVAIGLGMFATISINVLPLRGAT